MPCLTTCCCGFSVRAGTRAIAILSLVYSVLGLLMVSTYNYGLGRKRLYDRQVDDWLTRNKLYGTDGDVSFPVPRSVDVKVPAYEYDLDMAEKNYIDDKQENKEKRAGLELIMSVYSFAVTVNILVSLSLFVGVKLEKRWLLLPWVAWNTLSLIASQMAVFVVPSKSPIIADVFSTGLSIYCIMCVYSYFQILSSSPQNNPPRPPEGRHQPQSLPRLPLTVDIPPDLPPPYQPSDPPPTYDPPPPYPGPDKDKNDSSPRAGNTGKNDFNKDIP